MTQEPVKAIDILRHSFPYKVNYVVILWNLEVLACERYLYIDVIYSTFAVSYCWDDRTHIL